MRKDSVDCIPNHSESAVTLPALDPERPGLNAAPITYVLTVIPCLPPCIPFICQTVTL